MKKRKRPELLGEAVGLTLGATIVNRLPVTSVTGQTNSAFRIASTGLPLIAANYSLDNLKKLKKFK